MSLHNYKRSAFATVSAGVLLVPMIMLGANFNNTSAAGIRCNKNAKTIAEAVCMQDMKDEVLASMVVERQYELTDARDGRSYSIVRLADGHVWMTQNLDFDLDSSKTLTPDDTDVSSNYTPPLSTEAFNTVLTLKLGEDDVDESLPDRYVPHSYDVGDLYWNGERVEDEPEEDGPDDVDTTSEGIEESLVDMIANTSLSGTRHRHLGNYYTWTAAVAANESDDYFSEGSGFVDNSICPAGWTLPFAYNPNNQGGSKKGGDDPVDDMLYEPAFGTEVANIEDAFMYYVSQAGGWQNVSVLSDPFNLNLSGFDMAHVGEYGVYWTREYRSNNGTPVALDDPVIVNAGLEAIAIGPRLYGAVAMTNGEYASVDGFPADIYIPIRCVARAIEPIEASWIQGEDYYVGDEEESILLVEIPADDDLSMVYFDDLALDESSGVSAVPDDEGGVRIVFPVDFLNEQTEGEHTVRLILTSGRSAQVKMTVSRTPAVPNTGHNSNNEEMAKEDGKVIVAAFASVAIAIATSFIFAPAIYTKIKSLKKGQ